jgi:hypothetical protein
VDLTELRELTEVDLLHVYERVRLVVPEGVVALPRVAERGLENLRARDFGRDEAIEDLLRRILAVVDVGKRASTGLAVLAIGKRTDLEILGRGIRECIEARENLVSSFSFSDVSPSAFCSSAESHP